VPRKLVVDAMDKADIARELAERMGVGRAFRKELREHLGHLRKI
jgi:hypothetical protein